MSTSNASPLNSPVTNGSSMSSIRSADSESSSSSLAVRYDRYGFASSSVTDSPKPTKKELKQKKKEGETEARREAKWIKMLDNWDRYSEKKPKKIYNRLKKGVPDRLRAKVWQRLIHLSAVLESNSGKFAILSTQVPPNEGEIERDIKRTFPSNTIIQRGEQGLMNVLRAYSNYDAEVGYCQGMGFITGLFLIYMTEEEAFWLLVSVFKPESIFKLRGLVLPGLPEIPAYMSAYDRLLEQNVPKLSKHMAGQNILSSMYSPRWFITAFTINFPFDLVVRIWDVLWIDGNVMLFRIAIALMKTVQDDLLPLSFERILEYLKEIPRKHLEPNKLLDLAFDLPITRESVDELMSSQ